MNLDYRKLIQEHVLAQLESNGDWYEIHNAEGNNGEPARIRVYGIIGESFFFRSVSAADFVEELDQITASEIHVLINSVGGSAWDGIAIYNALRSHDARVVTKVEGVALSAASLIVQAGDERHMLGGTQMMIHNAWMIVAGPADYLRETAGILDKQDQLIAGIYAERTGKTKAHYLKLMGDETWLTDEETVDENLADEVVNPPRKENAGSGNGAGTTDSDVEDLIRQALGSPAKDPKPKDPDPKTKFSEHAASVLAEVDELIDRAEEVIAFRTDQGKPPLSEDSVELFTQLEDAHKRLTDVITSEKADTEPSTTLDDVDAVYARLVADDLEEEPA